MNELGKNNLSIFNKSVYKAANIGAKIRLIVNSDYVKKYRLSEYFGSSNSNLVGILKGRNLIRRISEINVEKYDRAFSDLLDRDLIDFASKETVYDGEVHELTEDKLKKTINNSGVVKLTVMSMFKHTDKDRIFYLWKQLQDHESTSVEVNSNKDEYFYYTNTVKIEYKDNNLFIELIKIKDPIIY